MKILLLVPPMLDNEPKNYWISPPLGLLSLAAYLEKFGYRVAIKDSIIENLSFTDLVNYLKKEKPDIVGITTMINTMNRVKKAANFVKDTIGTFVVLGGPHSTTSPIQVMNESSSVDFLISGEGELTLHELLRELEKESPNFAAIKSLTYRQNGRVIKNPDRSWIKDLNALPLPARHLVDIGLYDQKGITPGLRVKRRPATSMIISRGCPFDCTFCYKISGKTYRIRSPQSVVEEMKFLINNFGIKEVLFLDDNFTLKNDWVIELCDRIVDQQLDVTWSCLGRVAPLSGEMLKRMKDAGCLRIDLGIETGSERLRKLIKKGVTETDIREGVRKIRNTGIETCGYFIIGLPTESIEEAKATIRFAASLDLDHISFSAYTPFEGTELHHLAMQSGCITKDPSDFDKHGEVYLPAGWQKGDVDNLLKQAYIRFYFNPSKLFMRIRKIKTADELIQNINGALHMVRRRLLSLRNS